MRTKDDANQWLKGASKGYSDTSSTNEWQSEGHTKCDERTDTAADRAAIGLPMGRARTLHSFTLSFVRHRRVCRTAYLSRLFKHFSMSAIQPVSQSRADLLIAER
jgi:hypothetical protein